jgi:hypothetical protein
MNNNIFEVVSQFCHTRKVKQDDWWLIDNEHWIKAFFKHAYPYSIWQSIAFENECLRKNL